MGIIYQNRENVRKEVLMSKAIDVTEATWAAEVEKSEVPVVVDFWAPWCGPCRIVGPELDKLAGRVGSHAKFVKVNIDDNQKLAMRYGVMSIPTIAKFEAGAVTAQVDGARSADALGKDLGLI
jgi:thioredoxin 1